eukprot:TRINITY_DN17400_c0_g1_i2.p1 TRINITY_DN17400_c0_g1~~TRINITY_DN17400_c0_g1_i2.p1  ORF type:complete len:365 (-),score=23.32 TRINITY_DN17400_c0_g1_i2:163-1257(-)
MALYTQKPFQRQKTLLLFIGVLLMFVQQSQAMLENEQIIIQRDSGIRLTGPYSLPKSVPCRLSCYYNTITQMSNQGYRPSAPTYPVRSTPNAQPPTFYPTSFSIFIPRQSSVTTSQQSTPSFVPAPTTSTSIQDVSEPSGAAVSASDLINLSLAPSIFINPPQSCVTVAEFLAQESRFELFYEMLELAGFMKFFNQTDLEGTMFITDNSGFEQVFDQFGLTREEFFDDPFLPRIAAYSILDARVFTEDMENLQLLNTVLPDGDIYVRKEGDDEIFLVPIAVEFTGKIIEGDKEQCNIITHEIFLIKQTWKVQCSQQIIQDSSKFLINLGQLEKNFLMTLFYQELRHTVFWMRECSQRIWKIYNY